MTARCVLCSQLIIGYDVAVDASEQRKHFLYRQLAMLVSAHMAKHQEVAHEIQASMAVAGAMVAMRHAELAASSEPERAYFNLWVRRSFEVVTMVPGTLPEDDAAAAAPLVVP
jgi:hypothetical protein